MGLLSFVLLLSNPFLLSSSKKAVCFREASMFLRRLLEEHELFPSKLLCGEGTWRGYFQSRIAHRDLNLRGSRVTVGDSDVG